MKKVTLILTTILFLSFIANIALAQIPKEYYKFIKKADSLYKAKDYANSGLSFSSAFAIFGGKGLLEDRYDAARSWSMANNADSAFFQLFRIAEKSFYKNYDRVVSDPDFNFLHNNNRWVELLNLIKLNGSFNFGFERISGYGQLPIPWFQWGTKDFVLRVDSNQKHSGKYSILIEPTEEIVDKSFGCIAQGLDPVYEGKEIEVRAYIKMENITDPIGLMIRIDGKAEKNSLEFDNMMQKKITGTKDWCQYSVKLPLSKKATAIYIGVINSGSGKLWVDDFQVLIDGKDISEAVMKKNND